jgi:hypothetical protein
VQGGFYLLYLLALVLPSCNHHHYHYHRHPARSFLPPLPTVANTLLVVSLPVLSPSIAPSARLSVSHVANKLRVSSTSRVVFTPSITPSLVVCRLKSGKWTLITVSGESLGMVYGVSGVGS